jgi:hypothetical protein
MFKYTHTLTQSLMLAASKGVGGHVITSLSSFLTATRNTQAQKIAQQQLAVLNDFAQKTAANPKLSEYHKNYVNWAKEMHYLAKRPSEVKLRDLSQSQ